MAEFFEHKHHDGSEAGSGPGSSAGTNSTKIKERQEQGPPPEGDWTPPDGMTYASHP